MKTIEISEEEYDGIEKVAKSLKLSVVDLVLKGVKACTLILDLFPEQTELAEEDSEIPEEIKAMVTIGDKKYTSSSWRQLLQDVVSSLGCRRVFDAYPEDKRNILSQDSPDEKAIRRYVKVADGKYKFYLLVHFSAKGIKDTLKVVATSLGLSYKEEV
jgi:hypothetical protein